MRELERLGRLAQCLGSESFSGAFGSSRGALRLPRLPGPRDKTTLAPCSIPYILCALCCGLLFLLYLFFLFFLWSNFNLHVIFKFHMRPSLSLAIFASRTTFKPEPRPCTSRLCHSNVLYLSETSPNAQMLSESRPPIDYTNLRDSCTWIRSSADFQFDKS